MVHHRKSVGFVPHHDDHFQHLVSQLRFFNLQPAIIYLPQHSWSQPLEDAKSIQVPEKTQDSSRIEIFWLATYKILLVKRKGIWRSHFTKFNHSWSRPVGCISPLWLQPLEVRYLHRSDFKLWFIMLDNNRPGHPALSTCSSLLLGANSVPGTTPIRAWFD